MSSKTKLELKRDPIVIIPYTLFVLALIGGLLMKRLEWSHFLAAFTALNVPVIFGLKKGDGYGDDRKTPSMPPPPPPPSSGSAIRPNPLDPKV
jgi:hypothetical protein